MGAGRVAVWAAAVVGTLLTGLARVRVGAHWPSDIYGAWLWTLPTLLLLTVAADRLQGSRVLADRGRAKRWSVVESHSNATRSKRLSSRPQGAGATISGSGCPASDVARPASGPLWLPLRRVPGTTPSRIAMRRYRRVR
jgi:hypothetical protein